MDKIRNEIKEIQARLNVIEPSLMMCNMNNNEVARTQEYIEHRLNINENVETRMVMIEKYIKTLHHHLNDTITRVNSIHMYLKELKNEDLLCNEKMLDSDDDVVAENNEKN